MMSILKSGLLCLVALACWTTCQGYIATPLIGYQQGFTLQISPPQVAGGQCLVYGVPTPTGYADRAPGPLFVSTPKNTGNHVLQFAYDQAQYRLSPFLAPGQTTLQIDASDEKNPLISFDATASPQDQSGAVTVYLSDPSGANAYCSAQIQFTVSAPLGCLPNYGGVYPQNGGNGGNVPAPPNGAGNFVIPSGTVYAPTFVQQTIIQQFTTINNININNIVVNVNQITINNPIPEVPSTPPPVNCTEDPTNPVCASQPPAQPPLGPVPEPTAQPPNTPAQTPGFSILPVPPAQTPGPSTLPIGVPPSGNPTQTPGPSTLPIGVPPSSNPTQTPGVSTLPLVPPPVYVNPIRTPPSFGNGGNSQPPSQFNQSGRRMKV